MRFSFLILFNSSNSTVSAWYKKVRLFALFSPSVILNGGNTIQRSLITKTLVYVLYSTGVKVFIQFLLYSRRKNNPPVRCLVSVYCYFKIPHAHITVQLVR